jgi:hypothetical protein
MLENLERVVDRIEMNKKTQSMVESMDVSKCVLEGDGTELWTCKIRVNDNLEDDVFICHCIM